jgi:2'-hydroxyisoflavone reductase
MRRSRRKIKYPAAVTDGAVGLLTRRRSIDATADLRHDVRMRLLILGGTWFLGRTLASEALGRGWDVTAFTRGQSGTPPEGVRHVRGDRNVVHDLRQLGAAGPWDATIDTSAYAPADVVRVLDAIGDRAGLYALVSTMSAYHDWPAEPVDETSPLWPSRFDAAETDPDVAELSSRFQYGVLKAGCELAAATAPGGCLIVRPGVILGPGEYVGRMLTLLGRAARGGRWLLPAPESQPIEPIDVRDVSTFLLDHIAAGDRDVYNLTAPTGYGTYGDLIAACIAATGGKATPVWADPDWLDEQHVGQWTEIPLWRRAPGTWRVDSAKAIAAGLRTRSLEEMVTDTAADFAEHRPVPHPRQAEHGMDPGREAELLAAWDEHVRTSEVRAAGSPHR